MSEELEESLLKAIDLLRESAGLPDKIFVPEYGWIFWDGNPTEAGMQWYKDHYLKDE